MTLNSCFPAACRHPAFPQPGAVASALLLAAAPHSTWHGAVASSFSHGPAWHPAGYDPGREEM